MKVNLKSAAEVALPLFLVSGLKLSRLVILFGLDLLYACYLVLMLSQMSGFA